MDELCECEPQWLEQLTAGLRTSAEIGLAVGVTLLFLGIAFWFTAGQSPGAWSQATRSLGKAAALVGFVLFVVSLTLILSLPI